jgi:hypothetical protein
LHFFQFHSREEGPFISFAEEEWCFDVPFNYYLLRRFVPDIQVNVHKKCAAQLPQNCRIADGAIGPEQMTVGGGGPLTGSNSECSAIDGISTYSNEDSMIPLARLPGMHCLKL